MTQDVVRILATWMRHGTYGLNALLPSVPLETGVTRLTSVTILDETSDDATARKNGPLPSVPCLQVMTGTAPVTGMSPTVKPYPPDRRVEIGLRFVTKRAKMTDAHADADQVLRALDRSVRALFHTPQGEATRTRNQVQLLNLENFRTEADYSNDDTLLTSTLVVTAVTRDLWTA